MDLFEALKLVQQGKVITRQVWNNPGYHIKLLPDPSRFPFQQIHIFIPEKAAYDKWIMCSEDMDAPDWIETAPIVKPAVGVGNFPDETPRLMVAAKNSSPVPKKKGGTVQ